MELTTDSVREAIQTERSERRALLSQMVAARPNSRLAKKAGVLLLDIGRFDDWVEECGGEESAVRFVCAQVASNVGLKEIAGHYGLDRGLLWALLSETEERLQRYYRALRGVADEYVGEVVGIADGSSVEDVAVGKLQIDARLRVAEKYDAVRFGKQTRVTHEVNVDFGERLRRAQERVIGVGSITGEVVDEPQARIPDEPGVGISAVEVEDVETVGVEVVGVVAVEGEKLDNLDERLYI